MKVTGNKAPVYNQLGYVYLGLKQNDKAEECFNKYIELDPKNPNVYDSKGDYYMVTRDYRKAYELYMKAYVMDTSWSVEKARRAKQLYENTEGKKLDVITM
jgi:tetratricopeptide (TPR) repeat protein